MNLQCSIFFILLIFIIILLIAYYWACLNSWSSIALATLFSLIVGIFIVSPRDVLNCGMNGYLALYAFILLTFLLYLIIYILVVAYEGTRRENKEDY